MAAVGQSGSSSIKKKLFREVLKKKKGGIAKFIIWK